MITMGSYSFTYQVAAMVFVAAVWLLTLVVAIVAPAAKKGVRFRHCDVLALITTLAFGASWAAGLVWPGETKAEARAAAAAITASAGRASCASIDAGDSEAEVRKRLGAPAEMRDEQDLRGTGATAWLYPDSRCAVHMLAGKVESVE